MHQLQFTKFDQQRRAALWLSSFVLLKQYS